ncbi:hypothetical protein GALL_448200 [mine drainage metagenome]|uniref:Uncharacterized protein n=1 Tax=mine drainage metagenome TaxID=410659 RepID=A0A1J5Q100_9ZZZZ
MRVVHRLDHLDADAARDLHRRVGAVVGDHDDPLGRAGLADEGRDGLGERRLLVVRRDQDRDGHGAGEDAGGPRHHELGCQRVGPGVDGATGAVGDPELDERDADGEQRRQGHGRDGDPRRGGFGRVQDSPDAEDEAFVGGVLDRRADGARGGQQQCAGDRREPEDHQADQPFERSRAGRLLPGTCGLARPAVLNAAWCRDTDARLAPVRAGGRMRRSGSVTARCGITGEIDPSALFAFVHCATPPSTPQPGDSGTVVIDTIGRRDERLRWRGACVRSIPRRRCPGSPPSPTRSARTRGERT